MGIKSQALSALAQATESGDAQAHELVNSLLADFQSWETVREYALKERKRCNENVKAKLAALKEAMEVGHKDMSEQVLKLTVVEERWQDLEEARSEKHDVVSALREQFKLAETRLRERIKEITSPQLGLFTSTPTIDNPPKPEEDEDEEEDDDDPDNIP